MAYSFVQQVQFAQVTPEVIAAPSIAPTAGHALIIAVYGTSSDPALTDAQSSGDTYVSAGYIANGFGQYLSFFYVENCSGVARTISTTAYCYGIYVAEYSGIALTSALLGFQGAFQNGPGAGTNIITTGAEAVTVAGGALVFGFSAQYSGASDGLVTTGTGFTARTPVWATLGSGGTDAAAWPEDLRETASGSYAATWTCPTSDKYNATLSGVLILAEALPLGAALAGTPVDASSATGALSTAIKLAAAASSVSTSSALLTAFTTVTLTSPLDTSNASVVGPLANWSAGVPGVGATIYYDATYITINPNGSIVSTSNTCSALAEWNNGTTWSELTITITPFMVGTVIDASVVTGALTTAIRLGAAATSLSTVAGSLFANIEMLGAASSLSAATAALQTQIEQTAAAIDVSLATGSLSIQDNIQGAPVSASTAAANLTNHIVLLAQAAVDVTTAAAAITAAITMAGAAVSTSVATGNFTGAALFSGSAQAVSAATGALVTQTRLLGPALAVTYAAAQLSTQIAMAASAADSGTLTGALTVPQSLNASATSLSTASAQVSTMISMSGIAFAQAVAGGPIQTAINMSGGGASITTVASNLTATGSPFGLYTEDPLFVVTSQRSEWTQRFPVVAPDEIHVLTFNFASSLLANETLMGRISVYVVNSAGEDQNPSAILEGIASYDPTLTLVEQPEQAVISGNDYYFTVVAPTTTPNKTLAAFGLLSVRG